MNRELLSYIICPNCWHDIFEVEQYAADRENIIEGCLVCKSCEVWYRIENGILDLLPLSLRQNSRYGEFVKKHNLSFNKIEKSKEPQKEHQIQFFAKFAGTYDKEVADSPYFKTFDQVVFSDWIDRNLKPGNRILEVGCGSGGQCILTASRKIYTVGIDISEEMLFVARKKVKALGISQYADLVVADAERPPLKDNSFNGCVAVGTLHHVQDPKILIFNMSKKIVHNGAFFFSDPHKSSVRFIFNLLMKIWRLYDEEASEDPLFTEKQMKEWCRKAGIRSTVKMSTFLPPHIFYFFNSNTNDRLLRFTNMIFRSAPAIKRMAGIIVTEGVKGVEDIKND